MTRSTNQPRWTRREWVRLVAAGGVCARGWLRSLAADTARHPQRRRSCILLWMGGGPSQMDTFDLKPGHANGGPFKEISTSIPGVRVSELLPGVARQMKHLALVRSMSTREGDHDRATYLLRTGNRPQEPIQYPTLGSLLSKELGNPSAALPNYVSIASRRGLSDGGFSAGFLGPDHAPLLVGNTDNDPYTRDLTEKALAVPDLAPASGVDVLQVQARAGLLGKMNRAFAVDHESVATSSLGAAYGRALRLMSGTSARAFNLTEEKEALR